MLKIKSFLLQIFFSPDGVKQKAKQDILDYLGRIDFPKNQLYLE